MGIRLGPNNATQVWARKLANGEVAVALYNRGNPDPEGGSDGGSADITVHFTIEGISLMGPVNVFDIWKQAPVVGGPFKGSYTATAVPMHGTAFLRLSLA